MELRRGLLALGAMTVGLLIAVAPAPAAVAKDKVLYWTDPMVPGSRFDRPGKSPFMDMDLAPVYASDPRIITLDARARRLLGITTAEVAPHALARVVRTEGDIAYDERNVHDVTVRVNARVSTYYPFHVGLLVHKGRPLYELESPEIYSYIDQYLQLKRNAAAINAVSTDQSHILKQSETTLLWRGIPEEAIESSLARGRASDHIVIRAPLTGVVVKRFAVQGSLINAGVKTGQFTTYGAPVARIADIRFVYVDAKLFAADARRVHAGMPCDVYPGGAGGLHYAAKVTYAYPTFARGRRYAIARIALDNADYALKPGDYARVDIRVPDAAASLAVPRDAVIDAGAEHYAFVAIDESHYERRPIVTRAGAGAWVRITSGLRAGERVVTGNAVFFLDAAAALQAVRRP